MHAFRFLTLGLALAAVPSLAGAGPSLRDAVDINSEVVRIGDLVAGAGPFAQIAVFRAPDLGHVGSVPARQVLDAVRRHGLVKVDDRGIAAITVSRTSRVFVASAVEQAIADALARRRGIADPAALALSFDRPPQTLHVEPDAGEIRVAQLHIDPRSGRFDVTLGIDSSTAAQYAALRFTGTAVETVAVAMLARPVNRGDVIRPSDVIIERRPRVAVTAGALEEVEQLAGMAARRTLRPGQMLRAADIMKPELVRQNETVTVIYETAGLSLTVRGQALGAGAEGETISVRNIQSKRTMQGIVVGPGRVAVPAAVITAATAAP